MSIEEIIIALKVIGPLLAILGAGYGFRAGFIKYKINKMKMDQLDSEAASEFTQQFNKKELQRALYGYLVPKSSPSDPSNKDGEEFLAETRENIFTYMDRTIAHPDRSYHLILADTGMGKTLFCMNYYAHIKEKFSEFEIGLISLSGSDPVRKIKSIPRKSSTILILDALDEDPKGVGRGRDRLSEILEACSDFRNVIITCRSQYFLSDDHIPRETPLPILVNRKIGQSQNYNLVRSYIAPFDKAEIHRYIKSKFPIYKFWRFSARLRAIELAEAIPDLAYRPMLLERLPELALTKKQEYELFDLYGLLIDGWLRRESRWIDRDMLERVSIELAIDIFKNIENTQGRVDEAHIKYIAEMNIGKNPEWDHLTSRSLLNRDSKGKFKFAHKSILEFLVVKSAISGDARALGMPWTPFMKELFISWGYTDDGRIKAEEAKAILKHEDSRKNVSPLFDFWLSSPIYGLPDFKRCALRKASSHGTRLMPPSWRGSAIEISELKDRTGFDIADREFNLDWVFYMSNPGVPPMSLANALRVNLESEDLALPSYEQFVTLVEGLARVGQMVLPKKRLFALADKPGSRQTLLVEINTLPRALQKARLVDKDRKIVGTNQTINTYLTQTDFAAHRVNVQQLWIVDRYKLI